MEVPRCVQLLLENEQNHRVKLRHLDGYFKLGILHKEQYKQIRKNLANKHYYRENADKMRAYMKQMYHCDKCNRYMMTSSKSNHFKSKTHLSRVS